MSIKSCFSSSNKRLQELFDDSLPEQEAAVKAINAYHKELTDKLNKLRTSAGLETIPSNDIINMPIKPSQTDDTKLSKSLTLRIESAYENFYGKLPGVDRSKYRTYLGNRENVSVMSEQDKIARLEEAFGAKVVIDKRLEASGALLPANHPLTKMHNGPVIKINPDKLFADTVYHEFGHLYYSLLGGMSDPLVADAIEFLKGSDLWNTVADNYPELSGVELSEEVFATALGIEADMVFKDNLEKKTTWERIKAALYGFLAKIFRMQGSETSLERLAAEMLTSKPRLSPTKEFNNMVAKFSKYRLDNPTQEDIDKLFKALEGDYNLDEETHTYTDEEGNVYTKSVSTVAKNMLSGFARRGRGSYDIKFDEAWELTKDNLKIKLMQSVIPKALDDALNDMFRGETDIELARGYIKDTETWHDIYDRYKSGSSEEEIFEGIIEQNIEALNKLAKSNQDNLELPLVAGNIVHDALEQFIKYRTPFPERLKDKTGKLENELLTLIEEREAAGSKFYTEQMLFSVMGGIPGKADLIEITKDGKFKVYDFKTYKTFNKGGAPKNNYQMFVGPGYLNQAMIYGTILEEYGIQPAEDPYNILALEVDKNDLTMEDPESQLRITDFKFENLDINPKGQYHKWGSEARIKIIQKLRSPKVQKSLGIETKQVKVDILTKKIKRALDDYNKIADSVKGKFSSYKLAENDKIKELESLINKKAEDENEIILLDFIEHIRGALVSVYQNANREDQELTPEYVANMQFLLQVASNVDDIKALVSSEDEDFTLDDKSRIEILEELEEVDIQLSKVKSFHETANRNLVIATLSKHSNLLEGWFREKFEIEGRETGLKSREAIDAYIFNKMQQKETMALVEQKEQEYWSALLNKGYTDIRYLEWLLADPGMNKSQFVQVVKNIMDKADMDTRRETDKSIADIVRWEKELSIDKSGSPKKMWEKFLETGSYLDLDGKKIDFTNSSVIPEFETIYSKNAKKFDYKLNYLDRLILKALKNNDKAKETELKELREEVAENKRKVLSHLKKDEENTTAYIHPDFAKLSESEKEILRYIHTKLETADQRLATAQNKKLVRFAGDMKIYNLPKKRMGSIEAAYDAKSTGKRFVSGLQDFFRPPQDEDEINVLTESEVDDFKDFKTSNTDILGDPLYDVPVYYRNQLEDPSLQSFDIPSLLAFNEETTIFYQNYKMIEADLFNITTALKNAGAKKKVHKTDAILSNNVIDQQKDKLPKILQSDSNKVLSAVEASINNRLYQRSYNNVYSKQHYRLIKAGEAIGKYTSMTLLAANFGSGAMTTIQGGIYRTVEGIAGEDFNMKDVVKGSQKAWGDMGNMIADTQRQLPNSKTLLLIRRFGLETQYKALTNKFVQKNFITRSMDEGSIYAVTTLAETLVTANLMYTLMGNIKAINADGDFINSEGKKVDRANAMSLDEAYEVVDGELVLNKNVKFTDKNLTDAFVDDLIGEGTIAATEISRYIRSKYADLYGQYNQDMHSMAEMTVVGRLAFSMRKWLPRGFHRRYRGITSAFSKTLDEYKEFENMDNRFYSQDQKKFQEGYYATTIRWFFSIRKEMKANSIGFLMAAGKVNRKLTFHEKANLKRTAAEFAIMVASMASALLARVIAQGLDDDDRNSDKIYFAAYLAQRIYMESVTFIWPPELLDTLKTPAAAVNSFERIGNLLEQLMGMTYTEQEGWEFDFNDVYDRGNKKDQSKLKIKALKALPFYSKVSQLKGILGLDSNETIKDSYEYMK